MSTKPVNSPEEEARDKAKTNLGGNSSPKPAPTIDLPPEAVNRLEETPEATPSPGSATAAKLRTPMLVPALCGLLAGLGGGALISQIMPARGPAPQLEARLQAMETRAASPAIAPDVADRLKAAETSLAEIATRETALRGEIEQLARALRSEGEARAKGIAALSARPAGAPSSVPASPDLESLRNRLGAMDQALRALPEAIGAVGARSEAASGKIETISPRIDQLSARIEQIQPRIGALSEQVSAIARTATSASRQDGLTRATAFVTASTGLTELFRNKKPYDAALAPLSALGASAELLAPLQSFAKSGAPDGLALLAEVKTLRVKPAAQAASTDMLERFKAGALAMVEVRRTGEITGTDDEAHLARLELALQRGELSLASSLIDKLSADRKPAFAPFAEKLKARIIAETGLDKLRLAAQSALSEAAQALAK